MKKVLLSLAGLVALTSPVPAQNPDAIYIGTWDGMTANYGSHGVGTPITPDPSDPKLTYNADTQCYEGVIYDWAKSNGTAAWNAKIPYSFEGETVTYYSGTSYTNMNFGNNPIQSFQFIVTEDPSDLKGYNIATAGSENVYAAAVSLNLETKTITFIQTENISEAPVLVSISPENGSTLIPEADGTAVITLTFSGAVSSMRVLLEGSELHPVASDNGTVWTITLSASQLENGVSEGTGTLNIFIDQVYTGNTAITFDGGSLRLILSYPVEGYSNTVTFNFEGKTDLIQVYKSPFYTVGDEISIEDNSLELTYASSVTYLFTVPVGYDLAITSTVDSDDEENWSLGTDWSVKEEINPDTEQVTEENYLEGTTLTLQEGSNGAVFTITASESSDNGAVHSIKVENGKEVIYNLQGLPVSPSRLTPGIYIINGKKVNIK